MDGRSRLIEKFEKLGPRRTAEPVRLGVPGTIRISHRGSGKTIAAMMTLRRCGLSVLDAKRTIEAAVDRHDVVTELPAIDDLDRLIAQLAASGFGATKG